MDSHDDMDWLCTWGGQPIIQWERLNLSEKDPAVIDFVDYWLWKEALHVRLSDKYWEAMHEKNMFCFHMYVQELRASSDYARNLQLPCRHPP